MRMIFDVMACPPGAAQAALHREAERKLPAATTWDKPGSGARDVAIWLTATSACIAHPDQEVFLVSNDGRAFGKPELYLELVAEAPSNLKYCANIENLLDHLADSAQSLLDSEKLAASPVILEAAIKEIANFSVYAEILAGVPTIRGRSIMGINSDDLQLVASRDIHAYKVNNIVWSSAALQWRVTRRYALPEPSLGASSLVSWRFIFTCWTTMVVQHDENGEIAKVDVTNRGPITLEEAVIVGPIA